MLDLFTVFTRGGLVLWSYSFTDDVHLTGDPIGALISSVLLEERSTIDQFTVGNYAMRWHLANHRDLIFVIVYQKAIQLPYLDQLLERSAHAFLEKYQGDLTRPGRQFAFRENFEAIWQEIQFEAREKKMNLKRPRAFHETEKGKRMIKEGKLTVPKKVKTPKNVEESSSDSVDETISQPEGDSRQAAQPDQETEKPAADGQQHNAADGNSKTSIEENVRLFLANKAARAKHTQKPTKPTPTQKPRRNREWDGKFSKEQAAALDFSDPKPSDGSPPKKTGADGLGAKEKIDLYAVDPIKDDEDEAPKSKGLLSFFSSITNKELTEASLNPVLEQFRSHLIAKNVAKDVADQLCQSVKMSLIADYEGLSSTVEQTMVEALTRILTPKRTIDILREVEESKAKKKPYSIVFVGVNGVGKSTSLAKVCSWLLQNNLSVMIAACDTFRSGAVEQLQVHANALEVPLFHRGYSKDAAAIASDALRAAKSRGIDVVLIDTAGRMQGNEHLMRELAKLVGVNEPDLVLFVGEALVGNDSVDQLTKFNNALEQYSTSRTARGIDGIFLTKFDTVDDKVGAAISMVYSTGVPIVFTGIGQRYSDLRVLNVTSVVQLLMKGRR